MKSPEAPLLLSARDVARLLSVSVATVWRLESAGKVPKSIKVGGSTRWRYADIAAWIDAGCPGRDESKVSSA